MRETNLINGGISLNILKYLPIIIGRKGNCQTQVTKGKVAGGSPGFRRSATLLGVIQSCRVQGRSVLDFFRRSLSLAVRSRSHELSLPYYL
ncbi:hypothetical protein Tery_4842 [Trichodesmium erythraeum IMS101]|uniref:Uncharacterized protein n=1 Tax=Trichodesmium erythraeum (strain IMS101) TaxID=203124 RepID=Q10VE3_TRIEI